MLSKRTLLEIIAIVENWTVAKVDRMLVTFEIEIPKSPTGQNISKAKKANILLVFLSGNENRGPFTESAQVDSVQYLLEKFERDNPSFTNDYNDLFSENHDIEETDLFEKNFIKFHCRLYNSLKRDGYTINEVTLVSLLPEELIQANVENELFRLLKKYSFHTALGHLEQAIDNHSNGNWACANGQFRTFTESLLISITNHLIPDQTCSGFGDALVWLSNQNMLNPVLLSEQLNEVPSSSCDKPFINGLWKRLHPTGSHPGLSDEEDSTFRYHTLIVFARYLLKRIESGNYN